MLSRLPAQEWFTVDEAAAASGWSRSFMRGQIKAGRLAAQSYQAPERAGGRTYFTYRIHVDDLVTWILTNSGEGSKFFSEEKPFRDVCLVVRFWPAWMRRELIKYLSRTVTP